MSPFAPRPLLRALATGTLVVIGIGAVSVLFLGLIELTIGDAGTALEYFTIMLLYLVIAYPWLLTRRLTDEGRLLLPAIAAFVTLGLALAGNAGSGIAVSLIAGALLVAERLRLARAVTRA
jgi:uncharacterized membrane protein YhaH (DUF805 family)